MKIKYTVRIAQEQDCMHADRIVQYIEEASKNPDNGICKRSKQLIEQKIKNGEAVVAITKNNKWLGFCYIQNWEDGFVSSCALIVHPKFRKGNIARQLKEKALTLAIEKFPESNYFGLTTSFAVMKINTDLGYKPVIYSEITRDERFWLACKTCSNYEILLSKEKKNCFCTAMVYGER